MHGKPQEHDQNQQLCSRPIFLHPKSNRQILVWRILHRDIVLTGHGIGVDLQTLHHLGIDLCTSIVGALNTGQIASRAPFPFSPPPRLWHLLTTLQCPFEKLHSAGNNAHFTIRALLLLAAKSYEASVATLTPDD